MSHCNKERENLAERLATVLRRFEREGGDISKLAKDVGDHDRADLRRWANGTTLPGEVLIALMAELPRHLADHLVGSTGLRLVAKDAPQQANALRAAAAASGLSSDIATRMADGEWCHRDEAAAKDHAARVIAELQSLAGE